MSEPDSSPETPFGWTGPDDGPSERDRFALQYRSNADFHFFTRRKQSFDDQANTFFGKIV